MNTFDNLNLGDQLRTAIKKLGFTEPTQIQRNTIPLILEGKDVIGESATGSGKTLAFAMGIIKNCKPRYGIQSLVLVPTRELAEQVKCEIISLAYKKSINILAIYGGVSINPQFERLRRSEVVIATPGRLLDHLNRRTIDLTKINLLVLDEADRMVEMGFIEDVEKIIKACPRNRQTLLFSATMKGLEQRIAKKHMRNPTTINSTKMVDPDKLKQCFYEVPPNLKKELLVHLLNKDKSNLVMVFCNTRVETDVLVGVLKHFKLRAAAIHGGMTQVKRLKTIDFFHKGQFQILVCTDVASRGLHIEGVTHIYNYDIPRETNDYVHRIGRTARAGKNGEVINILSNRDYDNFSKVLNEHRDYDIEKKERPYLEKIIQKIPRPKKSGFSSNKRRRPRSSRGRGYGKNKRRSGSNFKKSRL